jgi:hypothetical protein
MLRNLSNRVLRTLIFLLLAGASTGCGGCASNKVVLHPIDQVDIQRITAGKDYKFTRSGYFLSDDYMKEVVNATVESKVR